MACPFAGMGYFGMELNGVVAFFFIGHAGDGAAGVEAISLNPSGSFVTLSPWLIHTFQHAVAFGCGEVLDAIEQLGVTMGTHFSIAKLAGVRPADFAAQLHCHGLHAVAMPNTARPDPTRLAGTQLVVFVGRCMATRQDDALWG